MLRGAGLPQSAEDLVQEAYSTVLGGQRSCPADVDFLTFLRNVIRSVASNWRKQVERARELPLEEEVANPDPDRWAKERTEKVLALFDGDPVARKVLLLMLREKRGRALRRAARLDHRGLATVRRRIRRRTERARKRGQL